MSTQAASSTTSPDDLGRFPADEGVARSVVNAGRVPVAGGALIRAPLVADDQQPTLVQLLRAQADEQPLMFAQVLQNMADDHGIPIDTLQCLLRDTMGIDIY